MNPTTVLDVERPLVSETIAESIREIETGLKNKRSRELERARQERERAEERERALFVYD